MRSGGRVSKVGGFNPPDEAVRASSGRRVANAGGAGCSADWWTPTVFSALLREELESLLDELLAHSVLLANDDNDRMLATPNTTLDMARRLPDNELVICHRPRLASLNTLAT